MVYPAEGFGVHVHVDGEAQGGRRKSKVTVGADVGAVLLKELWGRSRRARKSRGPPASGVRMMLMVSVENRSAAVAETALARVSW